MKHFSSVAFGSSRKEPQVDSNGEKSEEMSIQNAIDNQLERLGLINLVKNEKMKRYCLDTFTPPGSVIPATVFNSYVKKKIEEGYEFHPNYGFMIKDNPDGSRNIAVLRPIDVIFYEFLSQNITVLSGEGLFLAGNKGNLDFDAFIQNRNCTSYRLESGNNIYIPEKTIHTFKPKDCQGLEIRINYPEEKFNPSSRVCLQKFYEYWPLKN
tara:strand:- start:521 stop:1150 length:630 start_codon:yes stop_codon:yes gene_type:complete